MSAGKRFLRSGSARCPSRPRAYRARVALRISSDAVGVLVSIGPRRAASSDGHRWIIETTARPGPRDRGRLGYQAAERLRTLSINDQ
jgi:hypothetical protein